MKFSAITMKEENSLLRSLNKYLAVLIILCVYCMTTNVAANEDDRCSDLSVWR